MAEIKNPLSMTVIAVTVIASFNIATLWLFAHPEVGMSSGAMYLLGSLGSAFTAVIQWYFGSSMGSRAKDAKSDEVPSTCSK